MLHLPPCKRKYCGGWLGSGDYFEVMGFHCWKTVHRGRAVLEMRGFHHCKTISFLKANSIIGKIFAEAKKNEKFGDFLTR